MKNTAYMQLYLRLREEITAGAYPYGSRLPSKRTLAAETGVSVITAEHALSLLCEEGYAEARQRSGCFVIFRESDFQSASPEPASPFLPPVSPSPASAPAEFPYSVLARTMRKVLLDYGDRILIKSPNQGCLPLREEICAYLARSRGISVSPDQVVIGSGAEYLYGLIAQLMGKGRIFALEDPGYDKIRQVYASLGIACDLLPLRPDGLDSLALEKTGASVLHVTPFHSFPSGITAGISKKREYLRWASARNACIVEDNYDSELTVSSKPEDSLFSMAREEKVLYVNTFSKTVAPSIRTGYLVLPESMTETFRRCLGFYSCTVPVFEQYVLAELLRSGDFERNLNRIRRARRLARKTK